MKTCARCLDLKSKSEFKLRQTSADGLHCWCIQCLAAYDKEYRLKNQAKKKEQKASLYILQRGEALAYAKRRYTEKRDEISLRAKSYRDLNADKIRKKNRDWREENKDYIREKKSEWAKNNPEKVRSIRSKRRALELMATPRWVDHADIERVYKDAVDLQRLHGKKYHVDHIVPLNGKIVCGLHVAWNLQILTAEQNLKKGNRFNL